MDSNKIIINDFIRNDITVSLYCLPKITPEIIKILEENSIYNMYQLYGKYLSFFDGNSENTRNEFKRWLRYILNNCSDIDLLEQCIYEKISVIFIEL